MIRHGLTWALAAGLLAGSSETGAQETAMFGNTPARNMASDDTGLHESEPVEERGDDLKHSTSITRSSLWAVRSTSDSPRESVNTP